MLFSEPKEIINDWLGQQGAGKCWPESYAAIAWAAEKKLFNGKTELDIRAALSFSDFNGQSLLANIACVGGWMPKSLLLAGLWYAFGQLRSKRLTFFIEESNISSIRFVEALGATREATLRDAGKTGNLAIYALFPEDCAIWKKVANGQRFRRSGSPGL